MDWFYYFLIIFFAIVFIHGDFFFFLNPNLFAQFCFSMFDLNVSFD